MGCGGVESVSQPVSQTAVSPTESKNEVSGTTGNTNIKVSRCNEKKHYNKLGDKTNGGDKLNNRASPKATTLSLPRFPANKAPDKLPQLSQYCQDAQRSKYAATHSEPPTTGHFGSTGDIARALAVSNTTRRAGLLPSPKHKPPELLPYKFIPDSHDPR